MLSHNRGCIVSQENLVAVSAPRAIINTAPKDSQKLASKATKGSNNSSNATVANNSLNSEISLPINLAVINRAIISNARSVGIANPASAA